jgi:hypothetical protein
MLHAAKSHLNNLFILKIQYDNVRLCCRGLYNEK